MRLYSRFIFPHVVDLAMSSPPVAKVRRQALADVAGDVLEIGFGTGLNLAHYPEGVRRLTTVDVNPGMGDKARGRMAASPIEVDQQVLDAERLPFPSGSFDTVVSTWTLCSIQDVDTALDEVRRVLKPGGTFVFAEHGLSPDASVKRWQRRLTPYWKYLGDGCHLDRDIKALVQHHRFEVATLLEFYLDGTPRFAGYTYQGVARRAREDMRCEI